jgi:short-subunit dehydrogenase
VAEFKTAIVVGASSGIGEAMVKKLVKEGTRVAAVARRASELDRIAGEAGAEKVRTYVHDVRDTGSAPALFERILADLGEVDLLVYNSGVMPTVEESEYDFEKDREMIEVNLLGGIRWINLAAAYMEKRRAGTICGISSVAGDRGRRKNPVYTTSKAGFTAFLEAMRNRLSRYGVTVVTVKPGPVATAMTKGEKLPFIIPADQAADGAVEMMHAGVSEGYVPAIWGPIMMIIRMIPSVLFRRTNI